MRPALLVLPLLVLPLLVLPLVPNALAEHDPEECAPATVEPTLSVPAPDGHAAYLGARTAGRNAYVSLWLETNGLPGLQPYPAANNCGHPPDTLLAEACTAAGTIPGEFFCLIAIE